MVTRSSDGKRTFKARLRYWAVLFLVWTLVPLLLLGACEVALRAAGYGEPFAPFRVLSSPRGRAYVCDYKYLYSMFTRMPDTAKAGAGFAIPEAKEEGTYRIFVYGSSAAFGWIHNASFAQMLQVMLMQRFPGVRFEVYNLANGGLNSSLMRPLADACAMMHPDAYVIYMGNNEVHGPYGLVSEYSVRQGRVPTAAEIQLQLKLRQFRLGQLIDAALKPAEVSSGADQAPEELRPDDPRLARVWHNYASNMQGMFHAAKKAGAEVFISTLGANVRHWAPQPDLSWKQVEEVERARFAGLLEEGKALETAGRCDQALERYLEAEAIDDSSPYLHFRTANCLWALQAHDEARERYTLALELDSFCWVRAKRAFNDTVRRAVETGGTGNVVLVDGKARLEAAAPHATPGNESFADGCHLRPAGMYVLAEAFFEEMLPRMPEWVRKHEAAGAAMPDLDAILELLGFSSHLQEDTLEGLVRESREHGMDSADALEAELEYIRAHPVTVDRVRQLHLMQKIVEDGTEDVQIAHKFLECLGSIPGSFSGKVPALMQRLSERYYFDRLFQHNYLELLSAEKESEEVEAVCRRLLEAYPRDDLAYLNLASVLTARGDAAASGRLLEDARSRGARESTCHVLRGGVLLLEGNPGAVTAYTLALADNTDAYRYAAEGLREGLTRFPGTPEARAAMNAYLEIAARNPEAHLAPDQVEAMFDAWSVQGGDAGLWRECAEAHPDAVLCRLFLGMALEREGMVAEARAAYQEAATLYPDSKTVRFKLGSLEIRSGNIEEGLVHFVHVAERDKNEASLIAETWADLAGELQKQGNLQAAELLYRKAIDLYPVTLWPRVHLGQTYESMGNTAAAKEEYRQVLLVAPESPSAAGLLAELLRETETPDAAADFWRSLVETHPEAAVPNLHLGKALERLGKYDEAGAAYQKVLAITPDSAEASYRLSGLEILNGDFDPGLEGMKEAARKDPSLASDISVRLGEIADTFRERKQADSALRLYQAALDVSPTDLWPRVRLGEIQEEQGRFESAIETYRTVLETAPDSPYTARRMHDLILKVQNADAAVNAWQRLVESHPDNACPHLFLGRALENAGKHEEARGAYQNALNLKPDSMEALYLLAALKILGGEVDGGLAEMKNAASGDPSLAGKISGRLDEVAATFRQRGEPGTALTLCQAALEISPTDLWPKVRMGEICEEMGDYETALKAYRAILAEKPESPVTARKMDELLVKLQTPPGAVVDEWKAIVDKKPEAAVPLHHLGKAMDAAGDADGARKAYERAREINPDIDTVIGAAVP